MVEHLVANQIAGVRFSIPAQKPSVLPPSSRRCRSSFRTHGSQRSLRSLLSDTGNYHFPIPSYIETTLANARVLPPGFEPGIAVPKTAVISVSPREQKFIIP